MSCEVSHELHGPPDAPVVVLSCSLGTDRSMWDPQLPALSERHRVLRWDLRGHGASPVPSGPYEIADLGGDLIALLDRLEIERATLCGVSIGGMISMWVAQNAPERVQRAVLCCTTSKFPAETADVYRERAEIVREKGVEEVADGAIDRWFTPGFRASRPDVVGRVRAGLVATSSEGYAGCCEALAAMDLRPGLSSISAPALVIAGGEDPAMPPEHGQLIADEIPGARFTVIPGARHLANIERADEVTAEILAFID
jgi:3-oxoadipate enol-lactonase